MSKTSRTQYTILGMLAIEPKSGYDIKKFIEHSTANFWSESTGQLYPSLEKLLAAKLVTCDSNQGRGNRTRKLYQITVKGKKELQNWLQQPAELPTKRDEMLLKLFFGNNISKQDCINHLRRRIRLKEDAAEHLNFLHKHISEEHNDYSDAPYWILTIDYGCTMIQTEIEWCRKTITKLEKKDENTSN